MIPKQRHITNPLLYDGNRYKRNPSERDGLIKEVKHEDAVFSRLYLKK